jgi:DNA recombination protein RmuC
MMDPLGAVTQTVREAIAELGASQIEQLTKIAASVSQIRSDAQSESRTQRQGLIAGLSLLGDVQVDGLSVLTQQIAAKFDELAEQLNRSALRSDQRLEGVREEIGQTFTQLPISSAPSLAEIRMSIEECVQEALGRQAENQIARLADPLEKLQAGLVHANALTTRLGDLNRVLTSFKVGGATSEVGLESVLEAIRPDSQFERHVQVDPMSDDRVGFALSLPKGDDDQPVFLPIDTDYPRSSYDRLLSAYHSGSVDDIEDAARGLEGAIRDQAAATAARFIHVPRTTDFALIYLPIDRLFAEVCRRPRLCQDLQSAQILIVGPSSVSSVVGGLLMGFRMMANEKKVELGKHQATWRRVEDQLEAAKRNVERVGAQAQASQLRLRIVGTEN